MKDFFYLTLKFIKLLFERMVFNSIVFEIGALVLAGIKFMLKLKLSQSLLLFNGFLNVGVFSTFKMLGQKN